MKKAAVFILLFSALLNPAFGAENYPVDPDSVPQDGVPRGEVQQFKWENSKIFPGTARDYWVYVPKQYDPAKPACVMIFQDGNNYVRTNGDFKTTIVFDNLIHKKEMPVTIGIFINPGSVPPAEPGQKARANRSFEYDAMGDQYARFLLDEFLPEIEKKWNLTKDPEGRAVCGISSGGICAFTVAWERPDSFRKVLSQIGSFTNIRGGNNYPSLIRKTERKPIRVFLQDGSNDLDNLHGLWPLAAQEMAAALKYMNYDYQLAFGEGGHNGKHGGAILPQSLKWLWRDYPNPAPLLASTNKEVPIGGDMPLSTILVAGDDWKLVAEGYQATDSACADAEGNFYFTDAAKGTSINRITPDGKVSVHFANTPRISGLKFGPDGRLYACTQGPAKQIVAFDKDGKMTVIADNVQPNDLVVSSKGWVYFTDMNKGEVVSIDPTGNKLTAAKGINKPNGIGLSPDQGTLAVSEYGSTSVWAYRVEKDGSLTYGERYMTLRCPEGRADSAGDGMTTDMAGRYYVTSAVGIQIFDPTGRLCGVLTKPQNKGAVSVAFAGTNHEYLYVCCSDKVYRRKIQAKGALELPAGNRVQDKILQWVKLGAEW